MKILAIESSSVAGSAALLEDTKLVAQSFVNRANAHSENLLPMAAAVLGEAGVRAGEIDMFACTTGPGSFTGVRIGISTVKGLAFGKDKPCVGVSTLESAAYGLRQIKGLIVPVLDARRCGLYNALFVSNGKRLERLTPDRLIQPEEIARECAEIASKLRLGVFFAGDGYGRAKEAVRGSRFRETPDALIMQNAYNTALAALDKYNGTDDKSVFTDMSLAAKYLRAAQAERERIEKLANGQK